MANNELGKVGKVLLFAGMWPILTAGMLLWILFFFSAVLLPWFDITTTMIATTDLHDLMPIFGITFVATSIPGAYFAAMVIYKPSTMEDDRWLKGIGYFLAWMLMTIGYELLLVAVVIVGWKLLNPENPDDMHQMIEERRYFLVVAVIGAGYCAWWKLSDKKLNESREP